jgi:hypothetical protein
MFRPFLFMDVNEHRRRMVAVYDAILAEWRDLDLPRLKQDVEELERHRNNVHDWWLTALRKRGQKKQSIRMAARRTPNPFA